jgi:hypothetical protein
MASPVFFGDWEAAYSLSRNVASVRRFYISRKEPGKPGSFLEENSALLWNVLFSFYDLES